MPRISPGIGTRAVGRLLTLLVVALLAALLRVLGPMPGMTSGTMLLGFLLLAAYVGGELARDLHLPRITGYLVIGLLFGPHILRLLPRETVSDFRLINDIALSVIALQAGGELHLKRLRTRLSSITATTGSHLLLTLVGVAVGVYVGRDLFPFLEGAELRAVLAVALIFSLVAAALSPATTIAVITEQRARGPLTDVVLAGSVLVDVIILVLIALIIPTAGVLLDPAAGFDLGQLREIGVTIFASLVMGAVIGALITVYMTQIGREPALFALAVAFGTVELVYLLGFHSESYILASMTAGFTVQNFSKVGEPFVQAIEGVALPIYALFFAVAGADLDLGVIPHVWHVGLALISLRAVLILIGTWGGGRIVGGPTVIRRYTWMGFLSQAGVALGVAHLVRERFPAWGVEVVAIIIAMIAVNQLIGPPLFRYSLVKAREVSAS